MSLPLTSSLHVPERRLHRIPTKQKRRSTGQGAKKPLDPQRSEKTWVPAGTSGHELSRPKRVPWLPAYGTMSAMSIKAICIAIIMARVGDTGQALLGLAHSAEF